MPYAGGRGLQSIEISHAQDQPPPALLSRCPLSVRPCVPPSILARPTMPWAELSSGDRCATHSPPTGLCRPREARRISSSLGITSSLGPVLPLAVLGLSGGSPREWKWDSATRAGRSSTVGVLPALALADTLHDKALPLARYCPPPPGLHHQPNSPRLRPPSHSKSEFCAKTVN